MAASRSADRRLTQLLLEARGEATLLREQLLRTAATHTRLVRLLEIGWGVDLGQIAAATLDAAGALLEADAATLVLRRPGDELFVLSREVREVDERRLLSLLGELPLDGPRPVRLPRLDDAGGDAGRGFAVGHAMPLDAAGTDGALVVLWRDPLPAADARLDVLGQLALTASVAIANERVFGEVREAAARDPLTGLYNRRIFHEELARAAGAAVRYDGRLALCVFDVDDFKRVNTALGHLDGDAILVEIASCIAAGVRAADLAGRIGGDEFAVLLPHSGATDGVRLYERIGAAVRDLASSRSLEIGLSAGIAELRPREDPESFFRRADDSVRIAKASGKSRHVVAEDDAA